MYYQKAPSFRYAGTLLKLYKFMRGRETREGIFFLIIGIVIMISDIKSSLTMEDIHSHNTATAPIFMNNCMKHYSFLSFAVNKMIVDFSVLKSL